MVNALYWVIQMKPEFLHDWEEAKPVRGDRVWGSTQDLLRPREASCLRPADQRSGSLLQPLRCLCEGGHMNERPSVLFVTVDGESCAAHAVNPIPKDDAVIVWNDKVYDTLACYQEASGRRIERARASTTSPLAIRRWLP